ncbi:DUF4136 domain-containing protein [uncultured Sphingomonas sp.]|uniref:DUF4136 domain-containing protein n=1 Tax=uncultured Sphingomonas sp. TaxID=158754 RepID=UPI0025D210FB|nr:DUF4136 domain-containing protein [uncultured Sphingomonas sp.]
MSLRRKFLSVAAPAALLLVSACASSFRADVSRFQMMPPPQGQSFTVEAADPRLQGGIEFANYANLVSARLAEQGYRPAEPGQKPTLVVSVDYGVDGGHEKVVSTPGVGGFGGGFGPYGGGGFYGRPWGYGGFGRPFYGRGFYYGWADPFWYQPFGYPDVRSYTYYVSQLRVKIARAADNQILFEGKARARSTTDSLPYLVPNLVEAMFTGFPGRSGEDMLITVPPPPKDGQAPVNRGGR